MCAPDNPFCSEYPGFIVGGVAGAGGPLIGTTTDCGSVPIDLQPAGVNIMIAVDGAASMEAHWSKISTAIRSLRANNPSASFGVHLFWGDAVDVFSEEGQQARNSTNNVCSEIHNQVLELGDHNAEELVDFIGTGPQGAVVMDIYQVGPVLSPLNSTYLTAQTALADPNKTNYLVLFTGANENCFGSLVTSVQDKLLAFQKLSVELSKRNIRLIPVGLDAPSDAPVNDPFGFGPGLVGININAVTTNYEALGTMLKYGGADLTEVPRIDTPQKLEELISVVGQRINNCRFAVPQALDSSMSESFRDQLPHQRPSGTA